MELGRLIGFRSIQSAKTINSPSLYVVLYSGVSALQKLREKITDSRNIFPRITLELLKCAELKSEKARMNN